MIWYQRFQDGPEYEARRRKGTFKPPNLSLKDLRDAVPPHLFEKSTFKSLFYLFRHLAFTYAFYYIATQIDVIAHTISGGDTPGYTLTRSLVRGTLWTLYWGWQGVTFAGIWCLGHEAGHEALSPYPWVNAVIGIILHTSVLTPFYAWRATHRTHHKSTNNIERDETYIPATRKDFKLADGKVAVRMDYAEILEETPAFTLFKMFVRQFFGFQLYLIHNRKGNPRYPPGTSHYKPSSLLFKPEQRRSIIVSNIAMGIMFTLLAIYTYRAGSSSLWCYYFLPWLVAHNWIVMFTYLQHSDPTIPYYRKVCLGWMTSFFCGISKGCEDEGQRIRTAQSMAGKRRDERERARTKREAKRDIFVCVA
ncbi:fatty acid desaturase-domain-containing protein [Lyophyllum atratum]|nr:fatty acid desaturase-domain-containing protein [Lyophyllum atratum]